MDLGENLAIFGLDSQEEEKEILSYYWFSNGFSKEECENIKLLSKSFESNEATTFNVEGKTDFRKSKVRWIELTEDTRWIFDRLETYVTEANNALFKVDLTGFTEALQYTEYEGKGTHYGYHLDIGPGKHKRKLSIVVQLSDPNDYEGGDLMIHNGQEQYPDKSQGTVIVFPSILLHKVTPLISGNRYSIVSWVSGPPWR